MKEVQMKHEWNTGRQYDAHGQRMVAKVEDECILFSDRSRHINGSIPLGAYMQGRSLRPFEIETLVMHNYDHGNYSGSALTLYMEGESK
jgi:hypothetical protein